jgi:hypothetical protein
MTEKSVFHMSSILLLSQSPIKSDLRLSEVSLEDIAEMIKEFGGTIKTRPVNDQNTPFITGIFKIGNVEVWASHLAKNIAVVNQQSAFEGFEMSFPSGSNLTIMDKQYLVLSDATK